VQRKKLSNTYSSIIVTEPVLESADGFSRIRVECQYDGTNFSGWSIQPDRRSVQGVIEDVFSRVLDSETTTTVAGRTDAGVHALGQVFHFDIPETLRANWNLDSLLYIANRLLTSEIRIIKVEETSRDFHARYSALRRSYRYQLLDNARTLNPLERVATASYHRPLDERLMNEASALLLGERDFAAFCRAREGSTTIRNLERFSWERAADSSDGPLNATIVADAFCHNMVRALVGAMMMVGDGRWSVAKPAEILRSQERHSHIAPAEGLTLLSVEYPPPGEYGQRARRVTSKEIRGL
jgi:tRNA pseudouridine38-40 synthase